MAKQKTLNTIYIVSILAIVAVAAMFIFFGGQQASTIGDGETVDEDGVGPWANKLIQHNLIVKDEFTAANVAATAKVYDEQPDEWLSQTGDFDESLGVTEYTAAAGLVEIDEETPGTYYVVLEATGYNNEFITIEIPDTPENMFQTSGDYNEGPATESVPMAAVGTFTDEDIAVATLVNATNAEIDGDVNPSVADDTEFLGGRIVVTDVEGFSTDADNDKTYDEGVSEFRVIINGKEYELFNVDKNIDLFSEGTAGKTEFSIEDVVLVDGEDLNIEIEIVADTEDGTTVAANDELWSEGEGILAQIFVYDAANQLRETTDVVA